VFVLESPDMRPGPVALRSARAPGAHLRVEDLRRNPDAYEWRGLDGRRMDPPGVAFRGVVWVRAKGAPGPAQRVTLAW
jgi:hypothetical protein